MKNSPLLISMICSMLFLPCYFFVDKNYIFFGTINFSLLAFPLHVFLVGHFILELLIHLIKIKNYKEKFDRFLKFLFLSTLTIGCFYYSSHLNGLLFSFVLFLRYSWGNWHFLRSEVTTFSGKHLLSSNLFKNFILKWYFFCFIGLVTKNLFEEIYFLEKIQTIFILALPFYLVFWVYQKRAHFFSLDFPVKLNFVYFVCFFYLMFIVGVVGDIEHFSELSIIFIHVLEYYFISFKKSFKRIINRDKNESIIQTLFNRDLKIFYLIIIFNILYFSVGLYGMASNALVPYSEIQNGTTEILKWNDGSFLYFIFYDAKTYHAWALIHLSHGFLKDKEFLDYIYNAFRIKKSI